MNETLHKISAPSDFEKLMISEAVIRDMKRNSTKVLNDLDLANENKIKAVKENKEKNIEIHNLNQRIKNLEDQIKQLKKNKVKTFKEDRDKKSYTMFNIVRNFFNKREYWLDSDLKKWEREDLLNKLRYFIRIE